jgi:hypothetical protein
MKSLDFPAWLKSPLVWLAVAAVALAGLTDGGRAFAVFWGHEMQGWQWLSIPATVACILAMGLAAYLAVTHPSPLAILGAVVNVVAFVIISLAYVGLGAIWPVVAHAAWGVQAALPTVAGVLAAVMVALSRQAAEAEKRQAQDAQWRLLDEQNKRQGLLNDRYALQNKRLELKAQAATMQIEQTTTHTKRVAVHGASNQASARVLALLAQAQTSGLNVLGLSERALASALGVTNWTARQVKQLAKGAQVE